MGEFIGFESGKEYQISVNAKDLKPDAILHTLILYGILLIQKDSKGRENTIDLYFQFIQAKRLKLSRAGVLEIRWNHIVTFMRKWPH